MSDRLNEKVRQLFQVRYLGEAEKLIGWWLISGQTQNEVRFQDAAEVLGLHQSVVQNAVGKLARCGLLVRDPNKLSLMPDFRRGRKGDDSEQVREIQGERPKKSGLRGKAEAIKRALAFEGDNASDDG